MEDIPLGGSRFFSANEQTNKRITVGGGRAGGFGLVRTCASVSEPVCFNGGNGEIWLGEWACACFRRPPAQSEG